MKKIALIIAATVTITAPIALSATEQSGRVVEHKMGRGSHQSNLTQEEIVGGVKVTFKVIGMKEYTKAMDLKLPKDMKETHHISIEFKDVKSGKMLTAGEVKVKVQNPDKTDQVKDLSGMQGHFGGDFDLSQKGKYGFMCRFLLNEGKVPRSARFSYAVK